MLISHTENSRYLQTLLQLEMGGASAPLRELRRDAAIAIRTLLVKAEGQQVDGDDTGAGKWLDGVKEGLLPQYRVVMMARSGPWPQVTRAVSFGTTATETKALLGLAFERLDKTDLPGSMPDHWLYEVFQNDPFSDSNERIFSSATL